jgi:hypothetical protein
MDLAGRLWEKWIKYMQIWFRKPRREKLRLEVIYGKNNNEVEKEFLVGLEIGTSVDLSIGTNV